LEGEGASEGGGRRCQGRGGRGIYHTHTHTYAHTHKPADIDAHVATPQALATH
jgi:hypothetical protein